MANNGLGWTTKKEIRHKYLKKTHPKHPGNLLSLVTNVSIAKSGKTEPITIFATLQGTEMSTGGMFSDTTRERGYYQDRITVTMSLDHPQLMRISDGPQTYTGSGSVTSTVTISSGTSAGVGFFGSTPTANFADSVQDGNTNSFARQLTDFKVMNTSDSHQIVHDYRMAETKSGSYGHPADVVDYDDVRIRELPDQAIANFPIISQAAWQSSSSDPIDETALLKIHFRQHMARWSIWLRPKYSSWDDDYSEDHHFIIWSYTHVEKLPLFKLTGG